MHLLKKTKKKKKKKIENLVQISCPWVDLLVSSSLMMGGPLLHI